MSDIRFNCPSCMHSLDAPQEIAGQLIDCPACKNTIEIPFVGSKKATLIKSSNSPQEETVQQINNSLSPFNKKEEPDTKNCPYCGESILYIAKKCKHCGEFLDEALKNQREQPSVPQIVQIARQSKSRVIYVLLGLFLCGLFGVHNFYARRYVQAVIQLVIILLLGWLVVGLVINFLWVIGEMFAVKNDGDGRPMTDENTSDQIVIWVILIPIFLVFFLFSLGWW